MIFKEVINTITGRVHDKSGISDTFVINGERIYDKHILLTNFSHISQILVEYAQMLFQNQLSPSMPS